MPSTSATLTIDSNSSKVIDFLSRRYESSQHIQASTQSKGYLPKIFRETCTDPYRIAYRVAGRDSLLPISMGSWQWAYDVKPLNESQTAVTIRYRWSWMMTLLSLGTVSQAAGNEIVETAMALAALNWKELA